MIHLHRILYTISDYKFRIKMFLQKTFRGYSDIQIWNLDHAIVEFVLPKLKLFKEKYGDATIPGCFFSDYNDTQKLTTEESKERDVKYSAEWQDKLQSMIEAFELIKREDDHFDIDYVDGHFSQELFEANEKIINEGLMNFAIYFRALWN